MICATCLLAAEHGGSGSAALNVSVVDCPVKMPLQVFKQLLDITYMSKGLFQLWVNAFYLKRASLLNHKVRFTSVHAYSSIVTVILMSLLLHLPLSTLASILVLASCKAAMAICSYKQLLVTLKYSTHKHS